MQWFLILRELGAVGPHSAETGAGHRGLCWLGIPVAPGANMLSAMIVKEMVRALQDVLQSSLSRLAMPCCFTSPYPDGFHTNRDTSSG